MRQQNLFDDAPRHYHVAVERLSALDLSGCRAALEVHRRTFPSGPDPAPVEEAALWLAEHLPPEDAALLPWGTRALESCRALLEGRTPAAFSRIGTGTAGRAAGSIARLVLQRLVREETDLSAPVTEALPWGVFQLWAGHLNGARRSLDSFAGAREDSALAYLALGDTLWRLGRPKDSLRAYREGYGIDPDGEGWAPLSPRISEILSAVGKDPVYRGRWWVVGAYVEHHFPDYRGASVEEVKKRKGRFDRLLASACEGGCRTGDDPQAPALFFAGLFLSDNADRVEFRDLAKVRRTLRDLHPQAYEAHMEGLVGR